MNLHLFNITVFLDIYIHDRDKQEDPVYMNPIDPRDNPIPMAVSRLNTSEFYINGCGYHRQVMRLTSTIIFCVNNFDETPIIAYSGG